MGNYWDNYIDVDTNNDGIWDTAYSMPESNSDGYPLVEPWENYFEPPEPPSLPFTYTGDVLPSADGWSIVNYPDYESTGAHVEAGILHFTDFSSGSGTCIHYRREWPISPDYINVAEFDLKVVSCSELDGLNIGTKVGDYNMYYTIFPDRIQSQYRDYDRVQHLGAVYYFDTTTQFNTYKAVIEDERAKLYINGDLVLDQPAGLGQWNPSGINVVEFGTASSPATAEAYFDEVRAYTVCSPNLSWNVTISATNQLEPVVVGMHPNATDGYDPIFDTFVQTPEQGKVILLLDDIYSTSIKKTRCYNESVSWNFTVGVPTGQTTTLSWAVPSYVNLTILDGETVLLNGTQLGEGTHELTVIAELIEYREYCIDLKAGWNMVSIPIIPDNSSVQAIFGSIPTLTTMPVKTWVSPLFIDVDEVEPKKGYWVFTPAATTICVTGKPITGTTLNLKAGWNMVGTVDLENLTIATIPNQVSMCPAVTWSSPSFIEADVIEPGKAAWVFVTQNTIVTTGEALSFKMEVVPLQPSKMTKPLGLGTTEEWNLTISATNQLESVIFGLHHNATDNYDFEYDAFVQPPIQGKVIMILDNIYAKEINRERMTWNLSVGVPTGETATLSWEPSKIPTTMVLTLDGTDMKLQNSLQLGEGSHSFIIRSSFILDTGHSANPYPSIAGTFNGTLRLNETITVQTLYTYPCSGTGGHSEFVEIFNSTGWNVTATWNGYQDDWHNITFNESFVLYKNETYNYTIKTGSYPQIHHNKTLRTENGWINCTEFVDINGKRHDGWIPAIRLF